jgi:molybdopterin/thiamine biosynthesis adenylyltransferase
VATLRRLNSHIRVTGDVADVRGADQLRSLIDGFDILVQCADEPPGIRSWANRACLDLRMPWVDGGYHGPFITVGAYTPGNGPCWECIRNSESEKLNVPLRSGADIEKTLPRAPGNPVSAPAAMLSGALAAHAAVSLITDAPTVPTGCLFGINLMLPDRELIFEESGRRDDCGACAATPVA